MVTKFIGIPRISECIISRGLYNSGHNSFRDRFTTFGELGIPQPNLVSEKETFVEDHLATNEVWTKLLRKAKIIG